MLVFCRLCPKNPLKRRNQADEPQTERGIKPNDPQFELKTQISCRSWLDLGDRSGTVCVNPRRYFKVIFEFLLLAFYPFLNNLTVNRSLLLRLKLFMENT